MATAPGKGDQMRALVVYESMYGNTHEIAEAIGEGLSASGSAEVVSVHDATPEKVAGVDLLVVGGPTHAHGMSRESTRTAAVEAADEPGSGLEMDPDAAGDGVREWLESLGRSGGRAAAFDTRVDMAPMLTGRASKGISKQLHKHGYELVAEPESFLVSKETHLLPDERSHARAWGEQLGRSLGSG